MPPRRANCIANTHVPALPAEALERVLRRTWDLGIGDVPAGVVPYLTHPWVISNERLRGVGWAPVHTNTDAIREAVAAFPRRDPRPIVVTGSAVVVATGAAVIGFRRRARRRSG